MQTRFLLGPSGTGKTFRCLAEIRAALLESPAGAPLVFLAPKQATFQLERQLLADPALPGYTRLRILSFERLAEFILTEFHQSPPQLLSEEGRLMVLRALLSKKRDELKLFRATARLRGFAQQLGTLLRELQRSQLSPERMLALAGQLSPTNQLSLKLQDLAAILSAYFDWLKQHHLQDDDRLLELAAKALREAARPNQPSSGLRLGGLWLDGFAELAPQEMELLAALLPSCDCATLAFNVDYERLGRLSWLSTWSGVGQTFRQLHQRIAAQRDMRVVLECLDRRSAHTRFAANPVLRRLEESWSEPKPYSGNSSPEASDQSPSSVNPNEVLRLAVCAHPEAEATLAAREILRFVRAGGRFREVAVLVRHLEEYHDPIRRVFTCYDIPFFLDRREPVGHHPLSELTRSALRTVAFHWQPEDWFGALKTGLVQASETEIDRLENEALARGWKQSDWLQPVKIADNPELAERLESLRSILVRPFEQLSRALLAGPSAVSYCPTGPQLAAALRDFWRQLKAGEQLQQWSADSGRLVHVTLWEQMQGWLDNLELAFSDEALALPEWLPIVEAGLVSQTVGVIPPALDQVLVGAIDRSRNPDLQLTLVLGLNESVFPATPAAPILLTEADREQLSQLGATLTSSVRRQLSLERYLGYIACTRSRARLVLTCALRDAHDKPLNPSPFLDHIRRLFPTLAIETISHSRSWLESEHPCELIGPLLANWQNSVGRAEPAVTDALLDLPAFSRLRERMSQARSSAQPDDLSPLLAERLYGTTLQTSVSRLEEFAACPFKFFVSSGLKAEERKLFELDVREQGSFQHEVLARFHQELRGEDKRWRDVTPQQARERIEKIAAGLIPRYRDGLLQATEQSRFTARSLTASLQNFIETIVGWMDQYEFDPQAVELAFGLEEKPLPAWELDLGEGHSLSFRGKIDRVDLWRNPDRDEALCVVIDYKSSARKLDPLLMAHGIQLQLPAYLNVLRDLADPKPAFGVSRLVPAGVFFVNLRGSYESGETRRDVLDELEAAGKLAYRHAGRFDAGVLPTLDRRAGLDGVEKGDQFNYRLTKSGKIHGACREPMETGEFAALLDTVEGHLKQMGQAIFAGAAKIDPYRKGAGDIACNKCDYRSVCRIDPWTHQYRVLRKPEAEE